MAFRLPLLIASLPSTRCPLPSFLPCLPLLTVSPSAAPRCSTSLPSDWPSPGIAPAPSCGPGGAGPAGSPPPSPAPPRPAASGARRPVRSAPPATTTQRGEEGEGIRGVCGVDGWFKQPHLARVRSGGLNSGAGWGGNLFVWEGCQTLSAEPMKHELTSFV